MIKRESRTLEYKETVTNTFLKTVSAFANYGTGEIVFGITDNGEITGIDNITDTCLDIENKINDSIDPVPDYYFETDETHSVIHLHVREGLHKPYLYKSKAYRRNDSATIEADRLELSRLILEGEDSTYEELPAKNENLKFDLLAEKLKSVLNLKDFNQDTLKTLELYREDAGYNIAAELLADENGHCGTDVARFGDSVNIIHERITFDHRSVLKQFDETVDFYRKYYQYEKINGALRETVILIPEEAFREAIANALVHRTWDVNSHINVAMFPDRIELTSPGGLPKGMSEDEYFRGGISVPGNRIIANVFLRLNMIERFGTGIRRILESYSSSAVKPVFDVRENSIRIILPVIAGLNHLSPGENKIFQIVKGRVMSSSEIAAESGFGKSKTVAILKNMVSSGYIRSEGNGRGRKYTAE